MAESMCRLLLNTILTVGVWLKRGKTRRTQHLRYRDANAKCAAHDCDIMMGYTEMLVVTDGCGTNLVVIWGKLRGVMSWFQSNAGRPFEPLLPQSTVLYSRHHLGFRVRHMILRFALLGCLSCDTTRLAELWMAR